MEEEFPDYYYGGFEGPNAEYLKLTSSDEHEFIIKRHYAHVSGLIKSMLSKPRKYDEPELSEIPFREIPSHILERACGYFIFKAFYTYSRTDVPEFPIPPEIALQLLMTANFLDC